jgi:hypothetical protein
MFDPSTIAPGAGYRSHGMTYVSPSRLNLAVSQMPLFVMQYLMKMSSPVGAAAHRGQAVEGGVVMGLLDPSASIEACIKHAEGHFDRLCAFCGDPRKDKERQGIAGMVSIGIKELRQYGVPDRVQEKISRPIEGLGVDIMGFCDVAWSDNGCLIDLKTTHRIPSEISDSHARQLSHYIHGTNQDGRIAYLSSKGISVYRLEDQAKHYEALINVARRIDRFLSISPDPAVLASIVIPDTTSFFYSDVVARANARAVFGL